VEVERKNGTSGELFLRGFEWGEGEAIGALSFNDSFQRKKLGLGT